MLYLLSTVYVQRYKYTNFVIQMKVLHTADWHIGKILHKQSLKNELKLFFNWLIKVISTESVDVLLVSGDIFDLANPSSKDRQLYYNFLSNLSKLELQVIITGGNHDSINLLNAPKEILESLSITVIGGAQENIEDELIPIKNKEGEIELIIAAVPFLRDKDLRNRKSDQVYKDRTEAVRVGIKNHYAELANICESKYSNIPCIAMGHLYAKGSLTSDSEREIQVGNTAAIESNIFSPIFDYVALGHIHRPQVIGKNESIRYSGSPIALSFSEKKDEKLIVIVDIKAKDNLSIKTHLIPKFRELKKFKGSYEEVKSKLEKYQPDFELDSFVELEFNETTFSSTILSKVEALVEEFENSEKYVLLKHKTIFAEGAKDTSDLFTHGQNIEDLTPIDVFNKRLEQENLDEDLVHEMRDAFIEILEEVQTGE